MPSNHTASPDQDDQRQSFQTSNRLFRREATARKGRREPIDGLLRVTAPHEWLILIALIISISAFAAWGTFGEVERGLTLECLLVYPGERYTIASDSSGNVAEVFVEIGSMVNAGQPLARLRSSELDRNILLVQSKVDLLEERSGSEGSEELTLAKNDLLELTALQTTGQLVISHASGQLVSHQLTSGRALQLGDEVAVVREYNSMDLHALAYVSQRDAERLEPNMDARISLMFGAQNGRNVLDAEVIGFSDTRVESLTWLSALGLDGQRQVLELRLLEIPPDDVSDGTPCNSRIIYERGSPFSVIIP